MGLLHRYWMLIPQKQRPRLVTHESGCKHNYSGGVICQLSVIMIISISFSHHYRIIARRTSKLPTTNCVLSGTLITEKRCSLINKISEMSTCRRCCIIYIECEMTPNLYISIYRLITVSERISSKSRKGGFCNHDECLPLIFYEKLSFHS